MTDLIVSFSEVFKLQTCERQWWYRFGLNLSPAEESEAITVGVKGHKLLQDFYEAMRDGKTKEEALEIATENARKELFGQSFLANKSLLTAWTLVDNHIRATDFNSEALIIENRFLLPARLLSDDPLLEDIQIGFTPDVVMKRPGDKIDVEDSKFIQRAWSGKKLRRFPQTKLYQIFLERMGYDISRSLIRFFNWDTGKSFIHAYELGGEEAHILTRDFIAGVKAVVEKRSLSTLEQSQSPRTMNYTACQFCHFEFPCTLEGEGKDASGTFRNLFVKSTYDYNR